MRSICDAMLVWSFAGHLVHGLNSGINPSSVSTMRIHTNTGVSTGHCTVATSLVGTGTAISSHQNNTTAVVTRSKSLETSTMSTMATTLMTSLYSIPTDGPIPSAPLRHPQPGSCNSTRSPKVRGAGRWAGPVAKARNVVQGLTLEEKVNLTTGVGWMHGHCVGNIPNVTSFRFPGLCLEDGPLGVRLSDHVTAFPAGINAVATWDRDFILHRGRAMGEEFRGKGVNVQLGPMMNMGRNAAGGRNWEGFGADPYLAGEAAHYTVLGIQSAGIQACAKHYIGNEQEHNRTMESSNIDDRTMHEVYAHPFLRSVMADVASIMCSYNMVNGTYACENDKTMNGILKHEMGFQGYIMSDWQATESTLAAEAGLDMTMPGDITFDSNTSYFGKNLTECVNNGTISELRVDDMATRILAAWYLLEQDQGFPRTNFDAFLSSSEFNQHINVQTPDHEHIAYLVAAGSHVLLKNVNNSLPLKKPSTIALFGSDAGPPFNGPNGYTDRGGVSGTLAMGWGSGTAQFPYLVSPLEAIQWRAREGRTTVSWFLDDWDLGTAGTMAQYQDVAIVFINSNSGEDSITVDGNEGDRKNLTAWHGGDDLILAVAGNNSNTMVVMHSVGPLILEAWIEHPNVTAVIWAGLPGQESGNALRAVLYGEWNPSGKLPYTIAKIASDYSGGIITDSDPNTIKQIPYYEQLLVDYRWFDANSIDPRYEFGFGLSYTTFEYSNLKIFKLFCEEDGPEKEWAKGNVKQNGVGSSLASWLHRTIYYVKYSIINTGNRYGAEVSQLYLKFPASSESPPSVLRGFARSLLEPSQSEIVTLNLSRYDLSVWNTTQQGWVRPQGRIVILVGASSRDLRLKGSIPN